MSFLKKTFQFLIITGLLLGPVKEVSAQEMDPKVKAFLLTTGYGAASGALLGMATIAFGSSARSIAQGASIGLYAGMAFGAYIIYSHDVRQGTEYQDAVTPYNENGGSEEGSPYGPQGSTELPGGLHGRFAQMSLNTPRQWSVSYNFLKFRF